MNKFWIVTKQTYLKNVLSGSFIGMILGPILMLAVIGLVGYLIAQDQVQSTRGNIAIVDTPTEIVAIIEESDDPNEKVYDLSREEAQTALNNEEIEGYLAVEQTESGLQPFYYSYPTNKDINLTAIENALTQFSLQQLTDEMGLSLEQLNALQNTQVTVQEMNLQRTEDGQVSQTLADEFSEIVRTGVAYAVSIVVFIFIMIYVGIISQEIAAEKGSRIMEIILSSISATQHFLGKIAGIILMIITQVLCYVVIGGVAWVIARQFGWVEVIGSETISFIVDNAGPVLWLGLIYALLGILIYTFLAGFLGSLVSRTEDVNKMITPIILLALVGFYIGMYALSSTNNPIVQIGSQIPLFTPFIMPFRIAADTVSTNEIILSIILSILFMLFSLWISIVFYKSNVLTYSDKGLLSSFKQSVQLWQSERKTQA